MKFLKNGVGGFLKGLWSVPHVWKVWLLILLLANGIGPLFFFPDLAAVITFTCFTTGLVMAMYLTELYGYGKLLSIMHGPWIAIIVVNLMSHPGFGKMSKLTNFTRPNWYTEWLTASIVISIISLGIDFYDLYTHRSNVLKKKKKLL